MKKLILTLLIVAIVTPVDAGIFSRRRHHKSMPVKRVAVASQQQVQNIIINNATRYAYQQPLQIVSPAVIEQHSYDLAAQANSLYSNTSAQALKSSESLVQLQKMQAVLAAGAGPQPQVADQITMDANGIKINQPQAIGDILATKCASCHGADLATPKGELYLTDEMSDTAILNALNKVRLNEMPKDNPLTDGEKALFMQQLLDLRN